MPRRSPISPPVRALLPDDAWERRYELTFALELHRAECEFLTGELAAAESRLTMLVKPRRQPRSISPPSPACAWISSRLSAGATAPSRSASTICGASASQWSAHPTKEEVRQEYERMWRQLGDRPIEALLDLPLMADPAARATMDVLTAVVAPALFTDRNLLCLVIGRMANLSLEHGNSDGSCFAYALARLRAGAAFRRLQGGVPLRQARLRPGGDSAGWTASRPASTWSSGTLSFPGRSPSGRAARFCGAPSTRRSRPATSPMRPIAATTSSRTFSPAAIRSARCSGGRGRARLRAPGAVRSCHRHHHRHSSS